MEKRDWNIDYSEAFNQNSNPGRKAFHLMQKQKGLLVGSLAGGEKGLTKEELEELRRNIQIDELQRKRMKLLNDFLNGKITDEESFNSILEDITKKLEELSSPDRNETKR